MNTSGPFNSHSRPELSIKRRAASRPPMEAPETTIPFVGDPADPHAPAALQLAWDKLYRARAILEAEQAHLRDDRIVLQGESEALALRAQAVIAREVRLQQAEVEAALQKMNAEEARQSGSAITRITRAPFEIARSVFGPKK